MGPERLPNARNKSERPADASPHKLPIASAPTAIAQPHLGTRAIRTRLGGFSPIGDRASNVARAHQNELAKQANNMIANAGDKIVVRKKRRQPTTR